eukprot:TRINITY_DN1739_c0_g1_i1.p1 TRINITY_DN1739_c0_g1~~TRINITY_DN1739_c0_g1_i1.p1  ORF type:complete len:273 (-),score=50.54 TRINITY_DN1739_c0_g1_i1:212-1030(-)
MEQFLLRLSNAIFVGGSALSLAQSSLYVVDAGHRGVIFSRFDGVQDYIRKEGLNFRVPWLHRYFLYDVRTRPYTISSVTGSKDLQNISVTVRMLFRPNEKNLPSIHQKYGPDYQEKILPSIGNEVVKAVIAQYDAGELITQRAQVSRQIREGLTNRATEFHIEFDDISITHLKFGADFAHSIERKQVEQQEAERMKFVVNRTEVEQRAVVIKAEGKSEAARLVNDAMGEDGQGFIIHRRIETAREIAVKLARSPNIVYLPSTGNILLGLNES